MYLYLLLEIRLLVSLSSEVPSLAEYADGSLQEERHIRCNEATIRSLAPLEWKALTLFHVYCTLAAEKATPEKAYLSHMIWVPSSNCFNISVLQYKVSKCTISPICWPRTGDAQPRRRAPLFPSGSSIWPHPARSYGRGSSAYVPHVPMIGGSRGGASPKWIYHIGPGPRIRSVVLFLCSLIIKFKIKREIGWV